MESRVRLRVGLMVGDVECVIRVDKHAARPAELFPLFEEFSILIEDLDPIVAAVTNKQTAARIHSQVVRRIEVTRRGTLLPPGLDELAILREIHDTGVGISSMSVGDEDIAVRRDQDSRRLIERVRTISRDTGLA